MAEGPAPTGTFPGFMSQGALLYRRGEYGKALACFNNVRARVGVAAWGEAKPGVRPHPPPRSAAALRSRPCAARRALPCRRCSSEPRTSTASWPARGVT